MACGCSTGPAQMAVMKYYAACRADGAMISKLYSRKGDAKRQLAAMSWRKDYEGCYVQTYELVPVAEA